MKRIELCDLLKNIKPKLIHQGDISRLFLLSNNKVLKIFNPEALEVLKLISIDMEQKILDSEFEVLPKEIVVPEVAIYDDSIFIGYIMERAKGIDYNTRDSGLTNCERADLYQYASCFSKIENVVKNTSNIVYPDLCTCDNIYIDGDGIQLIDYDGFQVGHHRSTVFSSTLGDQEQYVKLKKYNKDGLLTKELDKKSLILLYFLSTFNVDLNRIGQINSMTGQMIHLDDIFNCIGLDDSDMMHKVWKIFKNNQQNEYLGEDVFRIADQYNMLIYPTPFPNIYAKRLCKK